ncbi:MAG: SpoIIE family protein phosphatase [Pseudomonadota bacterium]
MPLRTQITLLLATALFVVGAGIAGVGVLQRHLAADRLGDITVALQGSLWDSLVESATEDLDLVAAELTARLSTGAPGLNRDTVSAVIAASPDIVTAEMTVQVVDLSGNAISTTAPLFRSRPLIDRKVLSEFASGADVLRGLRQESPSQFVVAAMRPIAVQGNRRGAISVSMPAALLLERFSRETGEATFLLSPRGRLTSGTDPALWSATQLVLPRTAAHTRFISVADRTYFAAPLAVSDVAGGFAGTLVSLRDVTQTFTAGRRLEQIGLLGVFLAAILIVGFFYLLLRGAFQPLEDAVGALDALSKGDLSRPVSRGGAGEIARMGEAISVFRRNAQRLIEQDERILRQRRRQERVIRRELERLAGLLDPAGRAEVLKDLADILPEGATGKQDNAELATLAELLSRMSRRIADQQTRLTELIAELQAAIVTRARLAALEQELDIARDLQRTFLPRPLPPDPRFEVFGLMESAKEVGGDFFDHFMIDEDRLAVVIADVSGKGVPAALFMAITRTLIKATILSERSAGETVSEVNNFLAADNDQMMFVTLFLGVLSLPDGKLTFVNAGHNPPYRLHGDEIEALPRAKGPALAVVEEFAFTEQHLTLAPGDQLFLYTDGVTEAFNTAQEAFGEARLEAVLKVTSSGAATLSAAVRDAVHAFEEGAEQADDITCVTLCRQRAPGQA